MAMRRVESMPELGEARASASQETARALRSAKNSDESTEDAFAMATSEAAGDDEDARAERDEATKTREATARARRRDDRGRALFCRSRTHGVDRG